MTQMPAGPQGSSRRVSVVIPTRDRPAQLHDCLRALSASFPPDAEVIVVSDGGDRATFPDLSGFHDLLKLRVLHVAHGGPALARNRGLEEARGQVVAFVDDDCLPEPGWLEQLAAAVSLDPPTAAGGHTRNGLPSNPYAAASQLVLDMTEWDRRQRHYEPVFFPSNNLAFPTDALRRIGGFDPSFRTAEDRELCRRWLRAGHRLVYAPRAILSHAPEVDLAGYWRRFVAYGRGAARLHAGSDSHWKSNSLAFHLRVPALAAAVMREQNLERRPTLAALLMLWEIANLAGYLAARGAARS